MYTVWVRVLLVCSSRWQVDTSRDVTSSWQPAATGICWCQKPFLEQPAAEELLDLAETWSWIWSKSILHVGFIPQSDSWWQLYLWGRKQHKSHANWSQVKRGREDETVLVVRSVTCARFCMTCYFARKKVQPLCTELCREVKERSDQQARIKLQLASCHSCWRTVRLRRTVFRGCWQVLWVCLSSASKFLLHHSKVQNAGLALAASMAKLYAKLLGQAVAVLFPLRKGRTESRKHMEKHGTTAINDG